MVSIRQSHRVSLLHRDQWDRRQEQIRRKTDQRANQKLADDADRLHQGFIEYLERYRYFKACEWWRDARIAATKARDYRRRRNAIINRLRRRGFPLSASHFKLPPHREN